MSTKKSRRRDIENSDNNPDAIPEVVIVKRAEPPKTRETINKERRENAIAMRNADMADPRFKIVYDAIKSMVVGQQFNVRQFTVMVPLAMQTLSDVATMDGLQKKDLIVKVFKYLIEEFF